MAKEPTITLGGIELSTPKTQPRRMSMVIWLSLIHI